MYHKIQPEQIQIHAFSSPSGDLSFDVGSNYVYANLSRFLTGNFAITGGLSIDGFPVFVSDGSNTLNGEESFILGGTNNDISGNHNGLANSFNTDVLGVGNAAINARNSIFSSGAKDNTLLGGRSVNFNTGVTGSVTIKDNTSTNLDVNINNSLFLSFDSGTYFKKGNVAIEQGDLNLSAGYSGLFSGNLHALGTIFENGVPVATTGDLGVTSGLLAASILSTGNYAVAASGNLDAKIGLPVHRTGTQIISGEKTFAENVNFFESLTISGAGGILSGANGSTLFYPTSSGEPIGNRGLIAYSGEFLYIKISDNPHIWARHSGTINW